MKKLLIGITAALMISGSALSAKAAQDDDNNGEKNNATTTLALKGQVVDQASGESLTGVKIQVAGTDVSAYTDFEGNFRMQGLKPGTYELKTSFISYQDKTLDGITLQVSRKNRVTIHMKSLEE